MLLYSLKDLEQCDHSSLFLQKTKKLALYQPPQAARGLAWSCGTIYSDLDRDSFRLADLYRSLFYMSS